MNYLQLLNNPSFSLYLPYALHFQVQTNRNASSNYAATPSPTPAASSQGPSGLPGAGGHRSAPGWNMLLSALDRNVSPCNLQNEPQGARPDIPIYFLHRLFHSSVCSAASAAEAEALRSSQDLTAPHKIRDRIPTCSPGARRPARPLLRPPARAPRYLCRGLRAMARRARGSARSRGDRKGLPPPAARRLPESFPGCVAAFRTAGAKFLRRKRRRRRRSRRRRRRRRRKQVDIKV